MVSSSTVLNTARVVAQIVEGPTSQLTAIADATVEVVRAELVLEKSALRPVVLDPAAPAIFGPDSPTPRPARTCSS